MMEVVPQRGGVELRKREIEERLRQLRTTEVDRALVNGAEIVVGQRVKVRSESNVLEVAETTWAGLDPRSQVQYRLDGIYLGESGKVLRIFEGYGGKDGLVAVELRFADDAIKTFVGFVLEVGDYPPIPKLAAAAAAAAATATTSTKGKRLERAHGRVTPASVPTSAASHSENETKGECSVAHRNEAQQCVVVGNGVSEVGPAGCEAHPPITWPKQKPGRGLPVLPAKVMMGAAAPEASPTAAFAAAAAADKVATPSAASPLDLARSDSGFLGKVGRDLEWPTEPRSASGSPTKQPDAPDDEHHSADTGGRESSVSEGSREQHGEAPAPTTERGDATPPSQAHVDPCRTTPPALSLGTITHESKIPACREGYVAKFSLCDGEMQTRVPRLGAAVSRDSDRSGPPGLTGVSTPQARDRRHSASALDNTLPATPPMRTAPTPSLRRCNVVVPGTATSGEPAKDISITIRESHTSIAAVCALCAHELGLDAQGRHISRLFVRSTGKELTDATQITDHMSLVASEGGEFAPRPEPRTQRLREHHQPVVRPANTSRSVAGKPDRAATPKPAKATPAAVRRPVAAREPSPKRGVVTLRVYVNGDYGDARHNQPPDSRITLTVPPTHRTLASVLTSITRALQWHTLARKVEVLYDASGAEISDIGQLRSGTSVVASSGDRYIIPLPSSMLYRDLMAQQQQQGERESAAVATAGSDPKRACEAPGAAKHRATAASTTTAARTSRATPPPSRRPLPPQGQHGASPVTASSPPPKVLAKAPLRSLGGGSSSTSRSTSGTPSSRAQALALEIQKLERQLNN